MSCRKGGLIDITILKIIDDAQVSETKLQNKKVNTQLIRYFIPQKKDKILVFPLQLFIQFEKRYNINNSFIFQGTIGIDDNLGPDRLAGTKALDPTICRQLAL